MESEDAIPKAMEPPLERQSLDCWFQETTGEELVAEQIQKKMYAAVTLPGAEPGEQTPRSNIE